MTHAERRQKRAACAEAMKAGMTPEKAAKKFSYSNQTAYNIRYEFGIGVVRHTEREARRKRAAELVAQGDTPAEAADKTAVPVTVVQAACRQHGVSCKRITPTHASTFKILRMLLDGRHPRELAIEYGISRQRVDQIRDKAREAGFKFTNTTEKSQ